MRDLVNHPAHYAGDRFGCECIHVTMHMSFLAGNAYKYVWRHAEKSGVEDLRKALVYLEWAVSSGAPVWLSEQAEHAGRRMHDTFVLPHISGVYEALDWIKCGQYVKADSAIRRELEAVA